MLKKMDGKIILIGTLYRPKLFTATEITGNLRPEGNLRPIPFKRWWDWAKFCTFICMFDFMAIMSTTKL